MMRLARLRLAAPLGGIALLAGAASAQQVSGRVVEDGSRAALAGADITLLDEAGDTIASAVTDSTGAFVLAAPGAGRFAVRVLRPGYARFASEPLDIARDETVEVEIRLGADAIPIEPLVVTARGRPPVGRLAEFEQRRTDPARASGRFLTREQIEARPAARTTDLLATIPGVVIEASAGPFQQRIVAMSGSGGGRTLGTCPPSMYVDGVRIHTAETHTVDDIVDPSLLAGIEVYARAAFAPPQYRTGGTCGVILFWTQGPGVHEEWSWHRFAAGVAGFAVAMLLLFR